MLKGVRAGRVGVRAGRVKGRVSNKANDDDDVLLSMLQRYILVVPRVTRRVPCFNGV